jgi:hypothetical protein
LGAHSRRQETPILIDIEAAGILLMGGAFGGLVWSLLWTRADRRSADSSSPVEDGSTMAEWDRDYRQRAAKLARRLLPISIGLLMLGATMWVVGTVT